MPSSSPRRSTVAFPPSPGQRASTSAHPSRRGAIAGEIPARVPAERNADGLAGARAAGDDYWVAGVDRLILHVADRLRRAGTSLPEARLRRLAEEVVLDAARFVLDWVEPPPAAAPMRASDGPHAASPADAPRSVAGRKAASR